MKPVIAYNNISADYSSLTATSENASYPKENLTTWLPYEWWASTYIGDNYLTWTFATAKSVDYVALFSHNMSETGAIADFEYWTGSAWANLVQDLQATNSQVIMRTFAQVSSTQFRLKVSITDTLTKIGIVAFGQYMEMPIGNDSGMYLPHLESNDKILNGVSNTGLLLGRTIVAKSNKSQFDFGTVHQSWIRNNWIDFIDHAKVNPFFVSWDSENYPDDAVYCVTDGNVKSPKFNEGEYMSLSLKCMSWHQLRV